MIGSSPCSVNNEFLMCSRWLEKRFLFDGFFERLVILALAVIVLKPLFWVDPSLFHLAVEIKRGPRLDHRVRGIRGDWSN